MHKYKSMRVLALYIICIVKILCTVIYFQDWMTLHLPVIQDLSLYASIVSIPGLLAFMWNKDVAMLCTISLIAVLTIWGLALPASLLGIRFKSFRRISVVLIVLAMAMDFIVSLVAAAIEMKIICGLINVAILALAIICLIDIVRNKMCNG